VTYGAFAIAAGIASWFATANPFEQVA